jgi:hypothetical protein
LGSQAALVQSPVQLDYVTALNAALQLISYNL